MGALFLLLAMALGGTSAQLAHIGPNDPDYCYRIEKYGPTLYCAKPFT